VHPCCVQLLQERYPADIGTGSRDIIREFMLRAKAKAVPLHTMEALGGRGGIAPTHS
jgi:hypothetical protein